MRYWYICAFLLALVAIPASAQTYAYGGIGFQTSQGFIWAPSGMHVKFCPNANGTGQCVTTTAGPYTYAGVYYPSWYDVSLSTGTWYIFVWGDSTWTGNSADWGSQTVPGAGTFGQNWFSSFYANGTGFYSVMTLAAYPSPHAPTAVNPTNGQADVGYSSMTLKWSPGTDSWRNSYQAFYEIWGHGWGGQDLLQTTVSCNPDANGNCQYTFTNLMPSAYYFWHIVAKLNINTDPNNPFYTTSSPQFNFTTATNANSLISFAANDWQHYMSAFWCGGAAINATPTSVNSCEEFKIVDLNGGDLMDGDTVNIKTSNGAYYVTAALGGGDNVLANVSSAGPWETFTVHKITGWWFTLPSSRILNGDRITFRTYNGNYIEAVNNGGGSVDAIPTTSSPVDATTFIFGVH